MCSSDLYGGLGCLFPRLADWFLHHAAGIMEGPDPAGPDNVEAPVESLEAAGRTGVGEGGGRGAEGAGRPPATGAFGGAAIRGGWGGKGIRGFTLGTFARALPWETVLAAGLAGFWAARRWGRRS